MQPAITSPARIHSLELAEPRSGDHFAVLDVGAHGCTESTPNFFSHRSRL